jgi:excisionase family DNA binding protein
MEATGSERAEAPKEQSWLIGMEQAANLLGVSYGAIRGMIRRGVFPLVRVGRRNMIRRDRLAALVRDGECLHQDAVKAHDATKITD